MMNVSKRLNHVKMKILVVSKETFLCTLHRRGRSNCSSSAGAVSSQAAAHASRLKQFTAPRQRDKALRHRPNPES
ncbi:hypothetical protein Bpfe_001894 [Biomphalaria pfeifferi]|uniref:Uncharacterized protein n=1 Tax=Biomphalaria pfeifferi TaxID=112525 RepID=A0AAD8FMH6_BIOPF|nr:hypothetical protein Bpfe_001894 [Biomphalaria pfeifferi]